MEEFGWLVLVMKAGEGKGEIVEITLRVALIEHSICLVYMYRFVQCYRSISHHAEASEEGSKRFVRCSIQDLGSSDGFSGSSLILLAGRRVILDVTTFRHVPDRDTSLPLLETRSWIRHTILGSRLSTATE